MGLHLDVNAPGGGNQNLPNAKGPSAPVSTGSGKGSPAGAVGGPTAVPKDTGGRGLGSMANTSDMSPRNPPGRFTP